MFMMKILCLKYFRYLEHQSQQRNPLKSEIKNLQESVHKVHDTLLSFGLSSQGHSVGPLVHCHISIHITVNLPGTRFFLSHAHISGIYSPNSLKFCMVVGLWTLITGKLFWFGFLGNRCYGDQNISSELNNCLFWG